MALQICFVWWEAVPPHSSGADYILFSQQNSIVRLVHRYHGSNPVSVCKALQASPDFIKEQRLMPTIHTAFKSA